MSDIRVRSARHDEAALLTELSMNAKASWGYDEHFMELCRAELTFTPENMTSRTIWVAEYVGEVAGLVALAGAGEDAELEDLMVKPECQGRGVASALLAVVIGECRARGFKRIGVDADPNAEPIYKRLGFATVGQSPSGSIPGRLLPRMERTI